MSSRVILLSSGLLLLSGCGGEDQPTVRRSVQEVQEDRSASDARMVSQETGAPHARTEDAHAPDSDGPGRAGDSEPSKPPAAPSSAGAAGVSTGAEPAGVTPGVESQKGPAVGAAGSPQDATSTIKPNTSPTSQPHATAPAHQDAVTSGRSTGAAASPPVPAEVSPKPAERKASDARREVLFGGVALMAPGSWVRQRPEIKMILAEFSLPRSKGDAADAQLTVTQAVKNSAQGVERLREQIKEEEASNESVVEHLSIAGKEIILVDSSEESDASGDGPAAAAGGERDRTLNAMVFLGDSVFFVNCTGPEITVTERIGEFREFLGTMRAVK